MVDAGRVTFEQKVGVGAKLVDPRSVTTYVEESDV